VIRVAGLGLRIGDLPILEGVGFSVAEGESVALVGPNGSGKTSVLRSILGLVPYTGEVSVGGHDVAREPVAAKSLLAYLPQRPAFGEGTAREELRFLAKLRKIPLEGVDRVLHEVGLSAHGGRSTRTFSGGMLQRLSLALALLVDAPVLLLDEPTASLDREGQAEFLETAQRLRQRGRTLLLASHRAHEVAALTDRVLLLEGGRLQPETAERAPRVVSLAAAR
jgi:ABC-2 type transport system ATP-binding protein